MSLLLAEGFQYINTNDQLKRKYIDAGGWTFTAAVGRDGLQALTANSAGD